MTEAPGIPVYMRGGLIRCFTVVDPKDFDRLNRHRWHLTSRGYVGRTTTSAHTMVLMHRAICGLSPGDGLEVDHINRNKLDNRRANLRVCTRAENAQNHPGFGGASRFRGVFPRKGGRWEAKVRVGGRLDSLGCFASELEAARVAEAYRAEHLPFAQPDPELRAA